LAFVVEDEVGFYAFDITFEIVEIFVGREIANYFLLEALVY
jgi:hypothetical protein